jgi:MFS transporter, MCT family, solute carrier family 16 (monocarboxylic acid transporters), member 14
MMYLPAIVMVGYYFDKRRALAVGIAVCGTGIGTVVFAPFVSFLVQQFTWRGANIILGGVVLNGIVFGAFYRPLKVQVIFNF